MFMLIFVFFVSDFCILGVTEPGAITVHLLRIYHIPLLSAPGAYKILKLFFFVFVFVFFMDGVQLPQG